MSRLFAFGLGFSAQALAAQLAARDWEIAGTARDVGRIGQLAERGYAVVQYAGEAENVALPEALRGTTHLLHSIPPGPEGDPVLAHYRDAIAALPGLRGLARCHRRRDPCRSPAHVAVAGRPSPRRT